jgi:hypothetical protein
MLMSLLVTLTLVAQNDVNDTNEQAVQSFAERLKASHEQKKPEAMEEAEEGDNQNKNSHAARPFQVRMTQTVARRR